jgi:hypothetical protein
MDLTILGETTAKLMDSIDHQPRFQEDGAKLLSVGIVVVIEAKGEDGEDQTFSRTFCSDSYHYQQLGLFSTAVDTIRDGFRPDEED